MRTILHLITLLCFALSACSSGTSSTGKASEEATRKALVEDQTRDGSDDVRKPENHSTDSPRMDPKKQIESEWSEELRSLQKEFLAFGFDKVILKKGQPGISESLEPLVESDCSDESPAAEYTYSPSALNRLFKSRLDRLKNKEGSPEQAEEKIKREIQSQLQELSLKVERLTRNLGTSELRCERERFENLDAFLKSNALSLAVEKLELEDSSDESTPEDPSDPAPQKLFVDDNIS
jgi:hypothetical protein